MKDSSDPFKDGDLVKATWSDGLTCVGRYTGVFQGYVILIDKDGKKYVCNRDHVDFKIIT